MRSMRLSASRSARRLSYTLSSSTPCPTLCTRMLGLSEGGFGELDLEGIQHGRGGRQVLDRDDLARARLDARGLRAQRLARLRPVEHLRRDGDDRLDRHQ